MEFTTPSVEDHTRLAVIAAKLHAMATCPVLFARIPAKSAAIIRNAANYVMSLAHHVLRIVLGLVHIADGARYYVPCPVICYYAQSAVQRCWLVDIDVRPFVGRSVQVMYIVRSVRTQKSRELSLTLFCRLLSRRSILMRILALCYSVDTSLPWRAWMDI